MRLDHTTRTRAILDALTGVDLRTERTRAFQIVNRQLADHCARVVQDFAKEAGIVVTITEEQETAKV